MLSLWDEGFDRFANQFFVVTGEQLLGLEVREQDRALLIDDDHRIWRRVEHGLSFDHENWPHIGQLLKSCMTAPGGHSYVDHESIGCDGTTTAS